MDFFFFPLSLSLFVLHRSSEEPELGVGASYPGESSGSSRATGRSCSRCPAYHEANKMTVFVGDEQVEDAADGDRLDEQVVEAKREALEETVASSRAVRRHDDASPSLQDRDTILYFFLSPPAPPIFK